jgi:SAM-dependent methyltransferase
MEAEFDRYAAAYPALIDDPIRRLFAADGRFYHRRKWAILSEWVTRLGMDLGLATWLDVGCGQGDLLRIGRPFVGRSLGCDPSRAMLGSAGGAEVIHQADPTALPYDNASVDLVTAVCVYHHVEPELRPALTAEVGRVLKPGGLFAVVEHNRWNPLTQWIVHRLPVDADARLLSAQATRRHLARAGFEVAGTRYFLLVPPRLHRWAGWVEDALASWPIGGQYAVLSRRAGPGSPPARP